jgi:lysophospholipase L1-like esterase
MKMRLALLLTLMLLADPNGQAQEKAVATPKVGFALAIETFLKDDQTQPPPQQAILFVGSSIFRLWKNLPEQMDPLPVFNRAFGGSQTHEILAYMDRIVQPYKPKIIVYYCGSNDINANVSPARIASNFRDFVERVRKDLPQTRIFYVSIIRAPQKMNRWAEVDEVNGLVKAFCEKEKGLGYIDVNPALFDQTGQPRLELYLPDKLHFLDPAYVEFTKIIKPVLTKAWESLR